MAGTRILSITQAQENALKSAIKPYKYEVKSSATKMTVIVVQGPNKERANIKKDLEKKLKASGTFYKQSAEGGSVGSTELFYENKSKPTHTVRIIYKASSGGMQETTLNSSITELVPCIAFFAGRKKFDTVDALYQYAIDANIDRFCLNDQDIQSGKKVLETMKSSSKFNEKMLAGMGVLKFLKETTASKKIVDLKWAYRVKPKGVPDKHKGDIFATFADGSQLGISIKAEKGKAQLPQFNTYVNKLMDDYGEINSRRKAEKQALVDEVNKQIYSKKPFFFDSDWQKDPKKKRAARTDMINFSKAKGNNYEQLYDNMLEIVRGKIISTVNSSFADSKKWIKEYVLKETDSNVPLVVVKGNNKNYELITDEDDIGSFLPMVTSINAYASGSSKQNWHIDLMGGKGKLKKTVTLNMSIRSNKTPPDNKLVQGWNLAVKFNGIKVK
jgi:hypothetical protein